MGARRSSACYSTASRSCAASTDLSSSEIWWLVGLTLSGFSRLFGRQERPSSEGITKTGCFGGGGLRKRDREGIRTCSELGRTHSDLARSLQPADWALLESTPIIHHLPENGMVVVHAGLVPGVSLDSQDASVVMRIRSVSDHGVARDHGGSTPWGARYVGPPHAVFGHAASLEAQLHLGQRASTRLCVWRLPDSVRAAHGPRTTAPHRSPSVLHLRTRAEEILRWRVGVGGRAMIGETMRAHGPGPHAARRTARWADNRRIPSSTMFVDDIAHDEETTGLKSAWSCLVSRRTGEQL